MSDMPRAPLPAFVTIPGDPTAPAPIELIGVTLWAFPLAADLGALRALSDKLIATPSNGAVRFHPLLPMVLMSVTEFPNAFFPKVAGQGRARERELSFGIPGLYVSTTGLLPEIGFATMMPFLFLDNPVAIATGREEFGFFKHKGALRLPHDPGSTGFTVDVYGTRTFDPDVFWGDIRLLTLTDTGSAAEADIGLPWADIADAGAKLASVLLRAAGDGIARLAGAAAPLAGLALGHLSQIFLKQFRDIADGTRACYQAVTLARYAVTRLANVSLANRYAMALDPLDSAPVAATLGLGNPTETGLGVKVVMDMRLDPGRELWRA
jgi:hypothetical protein